jgi:hypothetical protein
MPYGGLRRRRQRKTDLRESFGAAQFSTFSTASTHTGSRHPFAAAVLDYQKHRVKKLKKQTGM